MSNSPQQPGMPGGSVCPPGLPNQRSATCTPPGRFGFRKVPNGRSIFRRKRSHGTAAHSGGSPPRGASSGPTRPSQKSGLRACLRTPDETLSPPRPECARVIVARRDRLRILLRGHARARRQRGTEKYQGQDAFENERRPTTEHGGPRDSGRRLYPSAAAGSNYSRVGGRERLLKTNEGPIVLVARLRGSIATEDNTSRDLTANRRRRERRSADRGGGGICAAIDRHGLLRLHVFRGSVERSSHTGSRLAYLQQQTQIRIVLRADDEPSRVVAHRLRRNGEGGGAA